MWLQIMLCTVYTRISGLQAEYIVIDFYKEYILHEASQLNKIF